MIRISANVPALFAAFLFAIAFLGSVGIVDVNREAIRDVGLVFLALTGMAIFNRGPSQ